MDCCNQRVITCMFGNRMGALLITTTYCSYLPGSLPPNEQNGMASDENLRRGLRSTLYSCDHYIHVRGRQGLIVHDQSVCEVYPWTSLGTRLPTQKLRVVWESCIQKAVTGYSIIMI